MKIAICLSGQFRTGEYALPSALNFFQGHDCDYFCHAWQDNNMRLATPDRYRTFLKTVDKQYTKEYIESILEKLKPKKVIIEENSANVPYPGPWSQMFYSLMISNWLKKEYEIENNFKYDVVVKTRYDFVYPPNWTFKPMFHKHEPLTDYLEIFSNHATRMSMEYSNINASDTIFYGSSAAMDIFCDLYRYLQWKEIKINNYDYAPLGPGCLMSEFAAKHNIRITSFGLPEVIYRCAGIGLDSVKDYEKLSELNKEIYQ